MVTKLLLRKTSLHEKQYKTINVTLPPHTSRDKPAAGIHSSRDNANKQTPRMWG